ncbi:MAG: hypothetical protein R3236_04725, partial [Phycisphaeraceae bacterium]|nr:hypothetical protein [Phycisphaeraceae bacterium]
IEALMLAAEALPLYKRARSVARVIRSERTAEIQSAHDLAMAEVKLDRTIDLLKRQLKVNPKNEAAARKLLEILIGEADRPAEVRKYSFLAPKPLKPLVAAATEATGELQAAQHLELGKWLHLRAREAPEEFQNDLLSRAKQHLESFLEQGPDTGANHAIATLLMRAVEADLDKSAAETPQPKKTAIEFAAEQSMKLFPKGTRHGAFPVQTVEDARGPFHGKGVYFRQMGGRDTDIYYRIASARPVKEIYYKGAASLNLKIEILDLKGRVLSSVGPFSKKNVWQEYTIKVPPKAGRRFILHFHNTISTWFYIHKIELR